MSIQWRSGTLRRTLTRRFLIAGLVTGAPLSVFSQPRMGDEEWIRQLHRFVKVMNEFLTELDDGKFDFSKWEESRSAWSLLDGGKR